jgi:hypothetical protein
MRIAAFVSNVFNPVVMTAMGALFLGARAAISFGDVVKWWAVIVAVIALPITGIAIWMARSGRLDDLWASVRQQRTEVYAIAVAFTALDFLLLRLMHAPAVYSAVIGTAAAGLALMMIVNLWWKVSVHMAFVTAFTAILVFCYGLPAIGASALMLLTGWSRVRLRQHTVPQVLAGAAMAVSVGVVGFKLSGLI